MGSNLSWRGVCGSRKLRNMKCSRSDFRPIEGTLKFEILWCEYLWVAGALGVLPRNFRNMNCSRSDSRPILGFGFVNGGFEILWYEYLWVAISPFGGFGGSSQENL